MFTDVNLEAGARTRAERGWQAVSCAYVGGGRVNSRICMRVPPRCPYSHLLLQVKGNDLLKDLSLSQVELEARAI